MLDRVGTLPGVRSAALGSQSLLTAAPELDAVLLPGESEAPEGRLTMIGYVSPGYFQTLGVRLLRGRDFSSADRRNAMEVAIVNQAMAQLVPLYQNAGKASSASKFVGPLSAHAATNVAKSAASPA